MTRLIIASNRLPVTARLEGDSVMLDHSAGGLATGMRGPHERSGGVWIGWPGDLPRLKRDQQRNLDSKLSARGYIPIHLTRQEARDYYENLANGVLWPVFQYLIEGLPHRIPGWDTYQRVNARFAEAIVKQYRDGDTVWVHDYQLLLVPALVRERLPNVRIGFFLHIPFPSDEVISVLPWRGDILTGLLGADLVGFHTASYARHFASAVRRILGCDTNGDALQWQGRTIHYGSFPMGVDAQTWAARASEPAIQARAAEIRREAGGRSILLGVDRLDYTKGIPRRLLAVEQLFERHPEWRDRVRLIQVTVPSREKVPAYASFTRQIDEMVGHLNGRYASPTAVPVHRIHSTVTPDELSALYVAADVMLVTSLRDGMNLVAKEFIASREDTSGALVLSEFAGAADELPDALIVNPYDVDRMSETIVHALELPADEQRRRMGRMRERVLTHDVHHWAGSFLDALAPPSVQSQPAMAEPSELAAVTNRMLKAASLVILLDYDGTLVPFAASPDAAGPDADLLDLLAALASRRSTEVHLTSGRTRDVIDRWFGHLEIALHAEHGLWSRPERMSAWRRVLAAPPDWKDAVRPILDRFVESTPDTFVEEKTAALVWHYRSAPTGDDNEYAESRARELRSYLAESITNLPVEIMAGHKVVEVRAQGIHKGLLADTLASPSQVLAMGDDATDEDLFGALPASAITIRVGAGETRAKVRIRDCHEARALLRALAEP